MAGRGETLRPPTDAHAPPLASHRDTNSRRRSRQLRFRAAGGGGAGALGNQNQHTSPHAHGWTPHTTLHSRSQNDTLLAYVWLRNVSHHIAMFVVSSPVILIR